MENSIYIYSCKSRNIYDYDICQNFYKCQETVLKREDPNEFNKGVYNFP